MDVSLIVIEIVMLMAEMEELSSTTRKWGINSPLLFFVSCLFTFLCQLIYEKNEYNIN